MIRKLLLLSLLTVCQMVTAQHVALRILSQTPVPGTEDARCLMLDHYGLMCICSGLNNKILAVYLQIYGKINLFCHFLLLM